MWTLSPCAHIQDGVNEMRKLLLGATRVRDPRALLGRRQRQNDTGAASTPARRPPTTDLAQRRRRSLPVEANAIGAFGAGAGAGIGGGINGSFGKGQRLNRKRHLHPRRWQRFIRHNEWLSDRPVHRSGCKPTGPPTATALVWVRALGALSLIPRWARSRARCVLGRWWQAARVDC